MSDNMARSRADDTRDPSNFLLDNGLRYCTECGDDIAVDLTNEEETEVDEFTNCYSHLKGIESLREECSRRDTSIHGLTKDLRKERNSLNEEVAYLKRGWEIKDERIHNLEELVKSYQMLDEIRRRDGKPERTLRRLCHKGRLRQDLFQNQPLDVVRPRPRGGDGIPEEEAMRPIKFRAWHRGANEMLQAGDSNGTTHPCDPVVYYMQGQPVKLMQFTGLLDKDGKEIFEGDIVCYGPWSDGEGFCRHIVEWNIKDAAFGTYEPRREKEHFPHIDEKVCEVIGNIYENPELLGGD